MTLSILNLFQKFKKLFKKNIDFYFLFIIISLFSLMLILRILLIFSYAPDISVGEDNNVWNVQKVLLGKKLYTNPEEAPFEIYQYSPLSQYPVIFISKILDLKLGLNVREIFIIGRTLSLLYILLLLFFIYYALTKWLNVSKIYALLISCTSFIGLTQLSFTFRPDALLTITFISSILIFIRFLQTNKISYLSIVALLSVISIFSKQNAIQLPIIFLTTFVLFSKYKHALLYLSLYIGMFSVFAGYFYYQYGDIFFISTIGGVSNPVNFSRAYQVWDNFFFKYMPFVLGFVFLSIIYLNDKKNKVHVFLSVSMFATLGFAVITMLKEGSWINYFTEYFVIGNIGVALYLSSITELKSKIYLKAFLLVFYILWGGNVIAHQYFHRHSVHLSKQPQIDFEAEMKIANYIYENKPEEGTYIFTPLKHLKNLLPEYSILPNTEFYSVSNSDFSEINNLINNRKIIYIITHGDLHSERTITNLKFNINEFRLQKEIDGFNIYTIDNE